MKHSIYKLLLLAAGLLSCTACNKEWSEEQYEQYVSFMAPMDYKKGVTDIYVKYNPLGKVSYQLPVLVSGSLMSEKNLDIKIAIDPDTLQNINNEHFYSRKDLWYKELTENYYEIPNMGVPIAKGTCQGLLDINFKLSGIDLVDKWVLPLTIAPSDNGSYTPHPRMNYRKALLRIIPFNEYSGTYSSTTLSVYFKGNETNVITTDTRTAYVVDDKSVFFYAGLMNEELNERSKYKIIMRFNDDGTVTIGAPDPSIHFSSKSIPTWSVSERVDVSQPYLIHKTVVINNLSYEFDDITSVPGNTISYVVKGSMNMVRKINTQIPDEDQAIEW